MTPRPAEAPAAIAATTLALRARAVATTATACSPPGDQATSRPTTTHEKWGQISPSRWGQRKSSFSKRVFVIVDNGSAHRGKASIKRLQGRYENLILVHTPVHASWLNQAEIYFSVVQRKALTPNNFADLDQLERTLLAFGRRYEEIARPFEWKFTRTDLHKVLERLDQPQPELAAAA